MKTIVFRPSIDNGDSFMAGKLEQCFRDMRLVDKTVVEDRVIYVFDDITSVTQEPD